MAADWGLLAKAAVGAAIAATTASFFPVPQLAVVAGSAALPTLIGDLCERTINNHLRTTRRPEQSPYDRAVEAALAAIAAAVSKDSIDEDQAARLTQALDPLPSSVNLSPERLTAAGFNASKLADEIIDAHPRLCDALSDAEITLARRLLTAGVAAALAQPELLTASEAAFRAAVLDGIHNVPQELRDFALDLQAAALLEPPQSKPFTGRAFQPTSTLLDARFGDLPLVGRDDVLADFDRWREDDDGAHVRLMIGPGGAGKTRLAIELCRRAAAAGWRAGFLAPPDRTKAIPAEAWDRLANFAPALIVVDYAENRAEDLRRLAAAAALRHGPGAAKLRLVLLARGAGEWWENRKSVADRDAAEFLSGPTVEEAAIDLEKLPPPDAVAIFTAAAAAFAKALNIGAAPALPDLTAAIFCLPLFVRIAALAAVEKQPANQSETDLLDWALDREDRLTAQYGGFTPDRDKRAVADAAALATLTGAAADRDGALALLRRLRDYAQETEERYVDWLKRLHPGPGDLNPLTPDRLGEHLADRQLERAGTEGGKLLAAALGDAATADDKAHALTVLVRLASAAPERGAKWLNAALNRFKDGLGDAALAAVFGLPEQTLALRKVAADLTRLALDAARRAAVQPDDLYQQNLIASVANNLSVRLSSLGRREEALDAIVEAVSIRRQLAEQRADASRTDLATSLNNMAGDLSSLGRREEALEAIVEAVSIHRQLAEQRPDSFRQYLALSLNNLSGSLSGVGRRDEALEAILEAVEIFRQLADQQPDGFLPDFAMALNTLASNLIALGRREEALITGIAVVTIRRQLADQRPDAFRPDFAAALNNLSAFHSGLGQWDKALTASIEAVQIYRQLAERHPDAFRSDLAMSLTNLSDDLSSLSRREEALQVINEAAEIYRQLAEQRPDAFRPYHALSLSNISLQLYELGRREEALHTIIKAVSIRRQLAEQRPDAFLPELAISLNNLAAFLSNVGRRGEALEAISEAVAIYRQMAEQRPDAFNVDLARGLYVKGGVLRGAARKAEAAAAFAEGLRLILPYARRYGPALLLLTRLLRQGWLEAEPAPDEALAEEALEFLRSFPPPADGAAG